MERMMQQLLLALALMWCLPLVELFAGDQPLERPNIIIILADDLGWSDLGCYGNRFNETPQIDRLAREGLRFTQFYAGPVCSPTRANLQSGLDQARFGITQHIPGHRRPFARLIDPVVPPNLPLEVETFAERLQSAGYATGYLGKWHLGGAGFGPQQQGWQKFVERPENPAKSTTKAATTPTTKPANAQRVANFLTEEAIGFISAHTAQPFLLQVSHYAVHIPLSTTPELEAKYRQKQPQPDYPSNPLYAGLLEELDGSVGRIVDAVDRLGLSDRTLILFLSDNGGLEHEQNGRIVTSNRPLRGEKGTLYEGGIRVPAIARWSGHIPSGAECPTPAITMDIYPTLLELSRSTPKSDAVLDGVSLAALLRDPKAEVKREALYWHLPHYHHSTPASAIRSGDWKMIEFFETGARQLYNLRSDPSESTDVSAAEPERTEQLHAALAAWRHRVGARLPSANPDFDASRAGELASGEKAARRKPRSAKRATE